MTLVVAVGCARPGPRFDDPREIPTAASPTAMLPAGETPPAEDLSQLSDAALEAALGAAYADKLANPAYVAWKDAPGLPSGYQAWPSEARVKRLRSEVARRVVAPAGIAPMLIPIVSGPAPHLDGRVDPDEWFRAAQIALTRDAEPTRLHLLSDGRLLFLACDVPGETTAEGYDQFRFYMHVDTSPAIRNERIHLTGSSGSAAQLGGIRETTVRWQGDPPANEDQRWRKWPISDWKIYRLARGRSAMDGHRQYEAILDLEEVGLHPGVPFPAFVEVETDPAKRPNGKFAARRYLGLLGSQAAPVWFVIGSPAR